jgi:hypothetical protein
VRLDLDVYGIRGGFASAGQLGLDHP